MYDVPDQVQVISIVDHCFRPRRWLAVRRTCMSVEKMGVFTERTKGFSLGRVQIDAGRV